MIGPSRPRGGTPAPGEGAGSPGLLFVVLVNLILSRDSAPGGAPKLHNAPGEAGQPPTGRAAHVIFLSQLWGRALPRRPGSPPEPSSVAPRPQLPGPVPSTTSEARLFAFRHRPACAPSAHCSRSRRAGM